MPTDGVGYERPILWDLDHAVHSKRLFVAIELTKPIRQLLVALNPQLRGVRWLSAEQMHLTISFLGNVERSMEEKLREKLGAIIWKPFFLPIIGLGTFPTRGWSKIVWIGVGTGHPHLFQLHKRVWEAVLASGLEPDLRPWHPHITLARCQRVSAQTLRPFLKTHADYEAGMIRIESFCLNSSSLTAAGSVYTRELVVHA
jgi:RNA 2',3'-cyclic 3'-phosphodiesterase